MHTGKNIPLLTLTMHVKLNKYILNIKHNSHYIQKKHTAISQ